MSPGPARATQCDRRRARQRVIPAPKSRKAEHRRREIQSAVAKASRHRERAARPGTRRFPRHARPHDGCPEIPAPSSSRTATDAASRSRTSRTISGRSGSHSASVRRQQQRGHSASSLRRPGLQPLQTQTRNGKRPAAPSSRTTCASVSRSGSTCCRIRSTIDFERRRVRTDLNELQPALDTKRFEALRIRGRARPPATRGPRLHEPSSREQARRVRIVARAASCRRTIWTAHCLTGRHRAAMSTSTIARGACSQSRS